MVPTKVENRRPEQIVKKNSIKSGRHVRLPLLLAWSFAESHYGYDDWIFRGLRKVVEVLFN